MYKIDYNKIKWFRRDKKIRNLKRKWVKHGEWKWKKQVELQNIWISRQRKKKIEEKIDISFKKKEKINTKKNDLTIKKSNKAFLYFNL